MHAYNCASAIGGGASERQGERGRDRARKRKWGIESERRGKGGKRGAGENAGEGGRGREAEEIPPTQSQYPPRTPE